MKWIDKLDFVCCVVEISGVIIIFLGWLLLVGLSFLFVDLVSCFIVCLFGIVLGGGYCVLFFVLVEVWGEDLFLWFYFVCYCGWLLVIILFYGVWIFFFFCCMRW